MSLGAACGTTERLSSNCSRRQEQGVSFLRQDKARHYGGLMSQEFSPVGKLAADQDHQLLPIAEFR